MVAMQSVEGLPPSVLELLRMFLTASSRGEHVSLVLESRSKTLSSKYWSVEPLAGAPADRDTTSQNVKKRETPSRLRRSRLRQEEFFRKKQSESKSSGIQKSENTVENQVAGYKQLITVLENQSRTEQAEGIPQVDGTTAMEAPDDTEVEVEFVSNYAEEDINDSLKEIFDEKLVPSLPTLVSRERVTQRSADHVCKVKLNIQGDKKRFVWPKLRGYPDFNKDVRLL